MAECTRCGTCCENGGPALHFEDRFLVESGRIPLKDLFTIRKGEPVQDNIHQVFMAAPEEMIKIKGRAGRWTCRYLDPDGKNPDGKSCRIYEHRPLECRILDCRKPDALKQVYNQNRLTRMDLLKTLPDYSELIQYHETHCGYEQAVRPAMEDKKAVLPKSLQKMIRLDKHLRQVLAEKHPLGRELADFLLGMPMADGINRIQ